MKKIVYLTLILLVVLLTNCNENNPNSPVYNPPSAKWSDDFPLKVGAYWIYEKYETDSNYVRLNNIPTYDTSMVDKIMTVRGIECFKLITNPGTQYPRVSYFYGDGSKLYKIETVIFHNEKDSNQRSWLLYNDFNNYNDTIIEQWRYIDPANSFNGYEFWKKAYRIKNMILNINDQDYNASGFSYYISINNWITGFITCRANKILEYYIKDIGLGYSRIEDISHDELGDERRYFTEKILIKYYIP